MTKPFGEASTREPAPSPNHLTRRALLTIAAASLAGACALNERDSSRLPETELFRLNSIVATGMEGKILSVTDLQQEPDHKISAATDRTTIEVSLAAMLTPESKKIRERHMDDSQVSWRSAIGYEGLITPAA
jgi:hypothetical protein